MKPHFFKLFVLALTISLVSCNNEKKQPFSDYKYTFKPETITCGDLDTKLLKEAVYTFENDISIYYNADKNTIIRAYSRLINESLNNRLKFENILSKHTVAVFEALKKDKTLWNLERPKSNLNYNSDVMNCISQNIIDPRLNSIFNSLKSTNSLSPKLFGEPIKNRASLMLSDKYLATYVALEFYYAKLFDIDFSLMNFEDQPTSVDFNLKPQKEPETDPHAGHNHD